MASPFCCLSQASRVEARSSQRSRTALSSTFCSALDSSVRSQPDRRPEPSQFGTKDVGEPRWPLHASVGRATFLLPALHVFEESPRRIASRLELADCVTQPVSGEHTLLRSLVVKPVQVVLDLRAGQPQAQVFPGHGLQGVSLVKDHEIVLGQQREALASKRQIRDIERVVDDQDVGRADPPPGLVVMAVVVAGALFPEAVAVIAGDRFPDRPVRACGKLRQAAVVRLGGPLGDLLKLFQVLVPLEQRVGLGPCYFEPPQADVVAPPFDQDGGELVRHHRPQKGDVLLQKLFLQVDGVRGDDNLRPRLGRRQDGRHQVGKAFAHPGPRLNHQVPPLLHRPTHRSGHFELLRSGLVPGQPPGDRPGRTENLRGIGAGHFGSYSGASRGPGL